MRPTSIGEIEFQYSDLNPMSNYKYMSNPDLNLMFNPDDMSDLSFIYNSKDMFDISHLSNFMSDLSCLKFCKYWKKISIFEARKLGSGSAR